MDKSDAQGNLMPQEAPERAGDYLGSANEHYRVLLAALDTGWEVEEPVYLRPRWGETGSWVYHFILKKEEMPQPYLVTVRHSQDVERLILREGWQVEQPRSVSSGLELLLLASQINQLYLQ